MLPVRFYPGIKKRSPGLARILAQPRQPRAYRTEPRDYVSGCKIFLAATNLEFT
jgi:hypothetical protein